MVDPDLIRHAQSMMGLIHLVRDLSLTESVFEFPDRVSPYILHISNFTKYTVQSEGPQSSMVKQALSLHDVN